MTLVDIFNRAKNEVGVYTDKSEPMKVRYLTLKALTREEYSILYHMKDYEYRDFKIFTDGRELCWMIDMVRLEDYPENSWIQFMA